MEIGEIAGRVREPMAGELRLQWWRDIVVGGPRRRSHGCAGGGRGAQPPMARRQLPAELLLRYLEAREFDLYDDPMPSLAVLERYAVESAGSIFQLAALTLGDRPLGDDLVRHAALAMSLTRCLRELGRDVSQGRMFVPLDVLERHGADPHDVATGRATPGVKAALSELADLAVTHHGEAARLTASAPASACPALLPLALVPLTLDRIRGDADPFRRSNSVPQWRRQWRLWRAARSLPPSG